jgi:hypothetical protein
MIKRVALSKQRLSKERKVRKRLGLPPFSLRLMPIQLDLKQAVSGPPPSMSFLIVMLDAILLPQAFPIAIGKFQTELDIFVYCNEPQACAGCFAMESNI